MMLRGWQVAFHDCTAIAQTTISYQAVFLLRSIAFLLYGLRLPSDNLMQFVLPKFVCILLKINSHAFCFLCCFVFLFQNFLKSNTCFTLKMDSDVRDGCVSFN